MHLSIETSGGWEDRGTLLVPIKNLLKNATFVVDAANAIKNDGRLTEGEVLLAMH